MQKDIVVLSIEKYNILIEQIEELKKSFTYKLNFFWSATYYTKKEFTNKLKEEVDFVNKNNLRREKEKAEQEEENNKIKKENKELVKQNLILKKQNIILLLFVMLPLILLNITLIFYK